MKKVKIDFDTYNYNRYLDLEARVVKSYDLLKKFGELSCGIDKVDMHVLVKSKNPAQHLISLYDELWIKNDYPPHISRQVIFERDTQVTVLAIQEAFNQFQSAMVKMDKHAPTINADGITSNIKMKSFEVYLNEEKRGYYTALNHLLDVVNELKQYNGVAEPIHLIRGFKDLRFDGLTPVIDINKFT